MAELDNRAAQPPKQDTPLVKSLTQGNKSKKIVSDDDEAYFDPERSMDEQLNKKKTKRDADFDEDFEPHPKKKVESKPKGVIKRNTQDIETEAGHTLKRIRRNTDVETKEANKPKAAAKKSSNDDFFGLENEADPRAYRPNTRAKSKPQPPARPPAQSQPARRPVRFY